MTRVGMVADEGVSREGNGKVKWWEDVQKLGRMSKNGTINARRMTLIGAWFMRS